MDWAFLKLIRKCPLDGSGKTLLLFGPCSIPGDDKGLEIHWGHGAPKLWLQTALSQPCGVTGGTFYSHRTPLLSMQISASNPGIACTSQALTLCPSAFREVLFTGPGLGLRTQGHLGPLRPEWS